MPVAVENGAETILQAAKEQLAQEGYRNLSIRKIAQRCGLASGTIYNYFPTKRDLIVEMMVDYWKGFFDSFLDGEGEDLDLYEQLRRVYDKLRQFVLTFQESWIDVQEVNTQRKRGLDSPQERAYLERLYSLVGDLLRRHSARYGEPAAGIDPDELARFIVLGFLTQVYTNQLPYDSFGRILQALIDP
jgi:AcrR family transcriptional regulator